MARKLAIGSRKGLVLYAADGDGWRYDGVHFRGTPVSMVMQDRRDGSLYAALDYGHFGPKLQRSDDGGSHWQEVTSPAFPKSDAPDAPADEWSGDIGCGVQYFSQQGVARLAPLAGFAFPAGMKPADQLVEVQKAMAAGDARARRLYETIGTCFGYAVAHYADLYPDMRNLLVLGRVTSGEGGEVILAEAGQVLREEFPALAERIRLRTPDEQDKRHGQAIAAASLPAVKA